MPTSVGTTNGAVRRIGIYGPWYYTTTRDTIAIIPPWNRPRYLFRNE
jgi:hypothetical protein